MSSFLWDVQGWVILERKFWSLFWWKTGHENVFITFKLIFQQMALFKNASLCVTIMNFLNLTVFFPHPTINIIRQIIFTWLKKIWKFHFIFENHDKIDNDFNLFNTINFSFFYIHIVDTLMLEWKGSKSSRCFVVVAITRSVCFSQR